MPAGCKNIYPQNNSLTVDLDGHEKDYLTYKIVGPNRSLIGIFLGPQKEEDYLKLSKYMRGLKLPRQWNSSRVLIGLDSMQWHIRMPLPSPWRWIQHDPPKRWYPTASLHGVTNEKTSLELNATKYLVLLVCALGENINNDKLHNLISPCIIVEINEGLWDGWYA